MRQAVRAQQPPGRVRHQHSGPREMEQRWQHHQRIAHLSGACPERDRLVEHLHQQVGNIRPRPSASRTK
ncbi:hypothetical protein [Streptomyces sp. ME02-6979.5a]|uniref:hypothetical protein n=1 Tax=Streptomyces sp. ME02-6979.5a TaxID=462925 RepID=UPI0039F68AE8